MSVTALKLNSVDVGAAEPIAEKMKRLRAEAQDSARSHAQAFVRALAELESLAEDIANGGEAYPVGIRQAAVRIGPDLAGVRLNVNSLLGRGV
jgi:hypothetical protein